jgi:hypothetical protein
MQVCNSTQQTHAKPFFFFSHMLAHQMHKVSQCQYILYYIIHRCANYADSADKVRKRSTTMSGKTDAMQDCSWWKRMNDIWVCVKINIRSAITSKTTIHWLLNCNKHHMFKSRNKMFIICNNDALQRSILYAKCSKHCTWTWEWAQCQFMHHKPSTHEHTRVFNKTLITYSHEFMFVQQV